MSLKPLFTALLLSTITLLPFAGLAQDAPFNIALEAVEISELGGVQSYAVGQAEGIWLIVGGRLDGLHRRQPSVSFDQAGHNNQLIVVDPVAKKKWTANMNALPATIREQLSSTNMSFQQVGDYLYCVGGYGYSTSVGDHVTFPNLTRIKVSAVIEDVKNGVVNANNFYQITNNFFQVAGGQMHLIDTTFYLLGGQKFMGRYNPMGPDHGPGFIQEYTNAIRIFNISNDSILSFTSVTQYTDTALLHRRDYNAEPQIFPSGEQGITMFSGVFQNTIDLPFLTSVNVTSNGYEEAVSFNQYYNHYHCASLPIYQESNQSMHTVFFGGIAQYYDSSGVLVQDDNVPFVNTIARVSRNANGQMEEYKLPITMPDLLGAGAEFIPMEELPRYSNGVLRLDSIYGDSVVIGYIYGGIQSTAANIFFINNGTESSASPTIYRVILLKKEVVGIHELNSESERSELSIYPNPGKNQISLSFYLPLDSDVSIQLIDPLGRIVYDQHLPLRTKGKQEMLLDLPEDIAGQTYTLIIRSTGQQRVRKIVIAR